MPQFYPSDDLTCWFTACFVEHYESLDEPDAKTFAFEVVEETEHINKGEEFLRNCNLANDTLVDAILHSVDWDDVIERFKTAIDYEEEEEETCVNCNKTKTEVWNYNTTSTKNAPVCYDCLHWEPQTRTCYKCCAIYTHETEEADNEDSGFCEKCLKKIDAEEKATTICPMAPHYCDEALEGKKCPHELCDIEDCRKHKEKHHTIILRNKGLTKCDGCGGIEKARGSVKGTCGCDVHG